MKYSRGAGLWACGALAALGFLSVRCGGDSDSSGPNPGNGGEANGGDASAGDASGGDASNTGGVDSTPGGAGPGGSEASGGAGPVGGAASGGVGMVESPGGAGGAGGEGPIAITGTHHGYVISGIKIATAAESFDIGGDAARDNQFGKAMQVFTNAGFNVNGAYATAVANGDVLMLGDVQATALADATGAGFSTFFGADPLPLPCAAVNDCGKHLLGTGTFNIDDTKPVGMQVPSSIAANVLTGAGGSLPFRLVFGTELIDLLIERAHVELTSLVDGGFGPGRIGGAIKGSDVNTLLYPAVQKSLQTIVTRDCTGLGADCGCTVQSAGVQVLAAIDANKDCAVPLAEVKANATIAGLLQLDVSIGADPNIKDGMSVAFAITGKKATFTAP